MTAYMVREYHKESKKPIRFLPVIFTAKEKAEEYIRLKGERKDTYLEPYALVADKFGYQ